MPPLAIAIWQHPLQRSSEGHCLFQTVSSKHVTLTSTDIWTIKNQIHLKNKFISLGFSFSVAYLRILPSGTELSSSDFCCNTVKLFCKWQGVFLFAEMPQYAPVYIYTHK